MNNLKRKLKQLFCLHNNLITKTVSDSKRFMVYKVNCLDCDKEIGLRKMDKKLLIIEDLE